MAEIEIAIDHFKDALQQHFSDQEKYMREISYPGVAPHARHHQILLKSVHNIFHIIKGRGNVTPYDINEFVDKILRHMLMEDGKLETYLREFKPKQETIFKKHS